MSTCANYPMCFGPYLLYAISVSFENFSFDAKTQRLFFLVEFKPLKQAKDDFAKAMQHAGFPLEFGPAGDTIPYATLRTGKAAVLHASALPIWDAFVSRVELSLPIEPTASAGTLFPRVSGRAPGALLIGVLDSGCPFSASRFLRTSGSTRVFAIWDQNEGKQPAKLTDRSGKSWLLGQPLPDFNYGLEYLRSNGPAGPALQQMGLDECIKAHRSPTGTIDEHGCYAAAQLAPLMYRVSHGAPVMDLVAGRIPPKSRVGDPPSWQPGDPAVDPACDADMVFVQFPDKGLRDHTGVWLKAHVLDGIRYILSCADPVSTTHVVINLSYGLTTGPHDGTSEIEQMLEALITEYDGKHGKPKLDIVVPSGNAYSTAGHVKFVGDGNTTQWTWRLPPDNTVPCFAEIWMKTSEASGVSVTLASPTGVSRPVMGPVDWAANTMWLLEVGATVAGSNPVVEHGDYTIKAIGVPSGAEVHAYVARTDPNLNMRTGARASRFVDVGWEQTRAAAAGHTRIDGELDNSGSLIDRFGTLNGLATGHLPGTALPHVAGGYIVRYGCGSTYSSAGPDRTDNRNGPDYALPCDDSHALLGVRAGGNRSGSVFRLIGTSAAAPQMARYVARGAFPPPADVPTSSKEVAKRGAGNLPPP